MLKPIHRFYDETAMHFAIRLLMEAVKGRPLPPNHYILTFEVQNIVQVLFPSRTPHVLDVVDITDGVITHRQVEVPVILKKGAPK